jgi:DNA-binding beta-propeller fold protein YncE
MCRVRRLILAALALVTARAVASAQTFTVERFNIGGDGSTDYLTAESGTGRVFISRQTRVMIVDGPTGKILGEIPGTPGVRGIAFAPRVGRGFTTNGGDSTVTMFDLRTLATIKKIPVKRGGLDGIMYDYIDDRIILTNHSHPGTMTVIDPGTGTVLGDVVLADNAPEGAVMDDHGKIYVNLETRNSIQVVDVKSMKAVASWPLAPCVGPTGIAMDLRTNRIFSGCSQKSVVVNGATGRVIATIANGDGVDAVAWDAAEHVLYIPAGKSGNVTVVRQIAPDKYSVIATLNTVRGAKTISFDPSTRNVYLFQAGVFVKISH